MYRADFGRALGLLAVVSSGTGLRHEELQDFKFGTNVRYRVTGPLRRSVGWDRCGKEDRLWGRWVISGMQESMSALGHERILRW